MKTKLLTLSILLLCASSLAACQTSAPPSCGGWEKIPLQPAAAIYLAGHDVPAGRQMLDKLSNTREDIATLKERSRNDKQ
jgi:hypothetical protein